MPNSWFALHGQRPSLIHGSCTSFASSSRFMHLFQDAPDTPLDSPFFATLSVHGLHFTVCTPSIFFGHVSDRFSDPFSRFANHFSCRLNKSLRCTNAQPFLCNELGPFQAILGNMLGPFSDDLRQFQAILGNLG